VNLPKKSREEERKGRERKSTHFYVFPDPKNRGVARLEIFVTERASKPRSTKGNPSARKNNPDEQIESESQEKTRKEKRTLDAAIERKKARASESELPGKKEPPWSKRRSPHFGDNITADQGIVEI